MLRFIYPYSKWWFVYTGTSFIVFHVNTARPTHTEVKRHSAAKPSITIDRLQGLLSFLKLSKHTHTYGVAAPLQPTAKTQQRPKERGSA